MTKFNVNHFTLPLIFYILYQYFNCIDALQPLFYPRQQFHSSFCLLCIRINCSTFVTTLIYFVGLSNKVHVILYYGMLLNHVNYHHVAAYVNAYNYQFEHFYHRCKRYFKQGNIIKIKINYLFYFILFIIHFESIALWMY